MSGISEEELKALFQSLPTRPLKRRLARCVPQLDFMDGKPPRFLFASGRRNRCNPEGIRCLYFAEDERTAGAEYRHAWRGLAAEHQPKLTFFAQARLRRIVDLGNPAVIRSLDLTEEDLFGSWRSNEEPTRLQTVGQVLARQQTISAIRFPSAACRAYGTSGWSLAIYLAALTSPDRIEILGNSKQPLEVLP